MPQINKEPPPKRSRVVFIAIIAIILLLSVATWWFNRILHRPAPDTGGGDVVFVIEQGMTLDQVANALEENGIVRSADSFKWAARIMRSDRKIQPGRFLLPRGISNSQLLRYLLKSQAITKNVTIIEGLTINEVAGLLAGKFSIDSTAFAKLCNDSIYAIKLGVDAGNLEGYLYPDTYNFYATVDEKGLIERMVNRFREVFNDTFILRSKELGFSIDEVVTLASIIQGEVMDWEEAGKISAVYHNRLKKRMLLEACPTIQYLLPGKPRRLYNGDLTIDSPYNTYLHQGLPPGPINNPGQRALKAALYPDDVDYLFMVARGDGTHAFNRTFEGHSRDKQKLQKIRRTVAGR